MSNMHVWNLYMQYGNIEIVFVICKYERTLRMGEMLLLHDMYVFMLVSV